MKRLLLASVFGFLGGLETIHAQPNTCYDPTNTGCVNYTAPAVYAASGAINGGGANFVNPNALYDKASQVGNLTSFWPSFRLSTTQHDGYGVVTGPNGGGGTTTGPAFTQQEDSFLFAGQYDLTKAEGLKSYSLKVGVFGGVGSTQAKFDLPLGSTTGASHADNTSGLGGGYLLAIYKNYYALALASGYDGMTTLHHPADINTTSYNSTGQTAGGLVGMQIPVAQGDASTFGKNITLDLRSGLSYAHSIGHDFTDDSGNSITDLQLNVWKASFSAKLATTFTASGVLYNSYIQAGYEDRFLYHNTMRLNGTAVRFTDDNNDFYGTIGITRQLGKSIELNAGLRGDVNSDLYTVSGQIGVKFDLN